MSKVRSTKVSTDNRSHSYEGLFIGLPVNILAATLVMTPFFMPLNNPGAGASGNRPQEGQPSSQAQINLSAPNKKPADAPTSDKTSVRHTAGHVVSINTRAIDLTALPDTAFGDRD